MITIRVAIYVCAWSLLISARVSSGIDDMASSSSCKLKMELDRGRLFKEAILKGEEIFTVKQEEGYMGAAVSIVNAGGGMLYYF